MIKNISSWAAAAALSLAIASPAGATLVVDTGAPNGSAVGAYAFDATDFYAGQVTFTRNLLIDSILTHILGGTAGETFTVALYDDNASHLPGTALRSATATFTDDGWNGLSGLTGWKVAAGVYWIAFELGFDDTLGAGSTTGALLDKGVPKPLARTAFNTGGGYVASATPLGFGVQIGATAVPEPAAYLLWLAGLVGMTIVARRRRS